MSKIRLGMVGYGFRGSGLWRMARQVPSLQPVAICDQDERMRQAIAADFPETRCFADLAEMLDSGTIDALLVETPPMTHADCTIEALRRGIHVLSDVPALHTAEEAAALWRAAQDSPAVYRFGATSNYWGFVRTCSELIAAGLLGELFYLEAEYIHDIRAFSKHTPWRQKYEPIRYCTHSLGPLLAWLGRPFTTVHCLGTGHRFGADGAAHDAMAALLQTSDNQVAKLLISFANSDTHGRHRFVCQGTEGCFECTWPLTGEEPRVQFTTNKIYGFDRPVSIPVSAGRPDLPSLEQVSGHGPLDYAMLDDFAQAINGAPAGYDLRAALEMTLPGLSALDSVKENGKLVPIRYPWQ